MNKMQELHGKSGINCCSARLMAAIRANARKDFILQENARKTRRISGTECGKERIYDPLRRSIDLDKLAAEAPREKTSRIVSVMFSEAVRISYTL